MWNLCRWPSRLTSNPWILILKISTQESLERLADCFLCATLHSSTGEYIGETSERDSECHLDYRALATLEDQGSLKVWNYIALLISSKCVFKKSWFTWALPCHAVKYIISACFISGDDLGNIYQNIYKSDSLAQQPTL